jgi:hypothetical protein
MKFIELKAQFQVVIPLLKLASKISCFRPEKMR